MPPVPFHLTRLDELHPVRAFTCGTRPGAADIDAYLHTSALAEQAAGLSTVWVAVDRTAERQEEVIVGYFTLSPVGVRISPAVTAAFALPSVPYAAVGGYLLGRLGVASNRQGHAYGATLVAAARKKALALREEGGGVFLVVDPKSERLAAWYEGLDFGFRRLDPKHPRLVLKL